MIYYIFQGTRKALNSIFSNFHRLVTGWPKGHTFKHLKRQVLEKLVDDHDQMFDKLEIHLQKSKLSYAQIVEAIHTCDNQEPIPDNTGEFIIAAISLTTNIPDYVVKSLIKRSQDNNLRTITEYSVETQYLFKNDKARGKGSNLIILVYNGIDYYVPAVPKEIVKLSHACSMATTHLSDALKLVTSVIDEIPGSAARDALSKGINFMGAAKCYLEGTKLATGAADPTHFPVEIAVPAPISSTTVAKMAYKRAAATVGMAPLKRNRRKQMKNSMQGKKSMQTQ